MADNMAYHGYTHNAPGQVGYVPQQQPTEYQQQQGVHVPQQLAPQNGYSNAATPPPLQQYPSHPGYDQQQHQHHHQQQQPIYPDLAASYHTPPPPPTSPPPPIIDDRYSGVQPMATDIQSQPQPVAAVVVPTVTAPAPAAVQLTDKQLTSQPAETNGLAGNAEHWIPKTGPPEQWNTEMCDCFADWKICCLGMWAPCMLYSRIHRRLRTNPSRLGDDYSMCNSVCWFNCCCGGVCSSIRQREEIRYRYNLAGSKCGDLCRHLWCDPCSLCQEEREIREREKNRRQIIQAQQAAGYQTNGQMVYGK